MDLEDYGYANIISDNYDAVMAMKQAGIKKRRIRKMALNIKSKLEIFLAPQQLVTWYEYNNRAAFTP